MPDFDPRLPHLALESQTSRSNIPLTPNNSYMALIRPTFLLRYPDLRIEGFDEWYVRWELEWPDGSLEGYLNIEPALCIIRIWIGIGLITFGMMMMGVGGAIVIR